MGKKTMWKQRKRSEWCRQSGKAFLPLGARRGTGIPSWNLWRELDLTDTLTSESGLRSCERINSYCFKPSRFGEFVVAASGSEDTSLRLLLWWNGILDFADSPVESQKSGIWCQIPLFLNLLVLWSSVKWFSYIYVNTIFLFFSFIFISWRLITL